MKKINKIYPNFKKVVKQKLGYNWFKDAKALDKNFPNLDITRDEKAFKIISNEDYNNYFIYVLSNVKTNAETNYKLLVLNEKQKNNIPFDVHILTKNQYDNINTIFKSLDIKVIKYFLNKNDLSFLTFNSFAIKKYNIEFNKSTKPN